MAHGYTAYVIFPPHHISHFITINNYAVALLIMTGAILQYLFFGQLAKQTTCTSISRLHGHQGWAAGFQQAPSEACGSGQRPGMQFC